MHNIFFSSLVLVAALAAEGGCCAPPAGVARAGVARLRPKAFARGQRPRARGRAPPSRGVTPLAQGFALLRSTHATLACMLSPPPDVLAMRVGNVLTLVTTPHTHA